MTFNALTGSLPHALAAFPDIEYLELQDNRLEGSIPEGPRETQDQKFRCSFPPPYPRDPPVLKIVRRVNFGTGRKFGTDVAKCYGKGSQMPVFVGRRGRKTVYRQ